MSSPSGSSSESSSSPAPTRKKRQVEVEASDGFDNCDTSDATSAESEEDLEGDAPQLLPSTEITVLSHAERRRQKKKQKRQLAPASDESPRKKRKLGDGTPSNVDAATKTTTARAKTKTNPTVDDPRRQKRQNSIWVGNLSFRTTQDALRAFFDGVGTIMRIHMPMRRGNQVQGENMGFAYIDFDTPEAKVTATTLSEGQLEGRNLLIKDGDDFAGRPAKAKTESFGQADGGGSEKVAEGGTTEQGKGLSRTAQKILRAQKQPPAPTLFLGNLGFETTEESIRELFEAHRHWGYRGKGKGVDLKVDREADQGVGESRGGDVAKSKDMWIRKIRMGTFEDSGACKGFGFVDFTSIEHATEALINPRNHRLNGRDLVIEYASPDAVRRGGGPRHPKGDRGQKSRSGSGKAWQNAFADAPHTKQRRLRHTEQGDEEDGAESAGTALKAMVTPRSRRSVHVGHNRPLTRRAKPGAALAQAQRQSAAILPSQGQKIVF